MYSPAKSYSLLAAVIACSVLLTSASAQSQKDPNLAQAQKKLRQALSANNLKAGNAAIEGLLRLNTAEAAKALAKAFPFAMRRSTNWYWAIIKGLATFTSAEALEQVAQFIFKYKTSAPGRDLIFALQSNYSPYCAPILLRIVQKTPAAIQHQALEHIGTLRQKSSVDGLIDMLEKYGKTKKPIVYQVQKTLRAITGQDFGKSVSVWRDWWKANRDKPLASRGNAPRTGTAADDGGGGRKYGYGRLTRGKKNKIIVIGATRPGLNFDNINNMLRRMQIPHVLVTKKDVNDGKVKFDNQVVAVFVNCSNFREHCICKTCKPSGSKNNRMRRCGGCEVHELFSDKLSHQSVKRIRGWVTRGGYLFTEDWGLEEILQVGFGSFVRTGPKLKEQSVGIKPEVGMTSHPYLRRMFAKILRMDVPQGGGSVEPGKYEEINHNWKIDDESPSIKITNKRKVKVLLASEELATKNKVDRAVAVTFPVGGNDDSTGALPLKSQTGGRVLHVLSHFGKQKNQKDGHTLQNLLLNYLIQANERWLSRQSRLKKPFGKK